MAPTLTSWLQTLKDGGAPGVAVAFSGGVDSTYLLAVAQQVFGEHTLAITARSILAPAAAFDAAARFCQERAISQEVIDFQPLRDLPGFDYNPENRCYLCKQSILSQAWAIARAHGLNVLCDGSNADDLAKGVGHRPGLAAVAELGVLSPLAECSLTKEQIRAASKELGLPTWNQPSHGCLATLLPYGSHLTPETLASVSFA
jgi:uncharacterized protein